MGGGGEWWRKSSRKKDIPNQNVGKGEVQEPWHKGELGRKVKGDHRHLVHVGRGAID